MADACRHHVGLSMMVGLGTGMLVMASCRNPHTRLLSTSCMLDMTVMRCPSRRKPHLGHIASREQEAQAALQHLGHSRAAVPPHGLDALGIKGRLGLTRRLVHHAHVALLGLQHAGVVHLHMSWISGLRVVVWVLLPACPVDWGAGPMFAGPGRQDAGRG